MKNQIIVGPLLGFERGNYYTVCILTDGLAGGPQLAVAGQTIPFAKLDVLDFSLGKANLLVVSPGVGVRYFLTRQTSFDVTAAYNHAVASFDNTKAEAGIVTILLGFSYFFGGGDRR